MFVLNVFNILSRIYIELIQIGHDRFKKSRINHSQEEEVKYMRHCAPTLRTSIKKTNKSDYIIEIQNMFVLLKGFLKIKFELKTYNISYVWFTLVWRKPFENLKGIKIWVIKKMPTLIGCIVKTFLKTVKSIQSSFFLLLKKYCYRFCNKPFATGIYLLKMFRAHF